MFNEEELTLDQIDNLEAQLHEAIVDSNLGVHAALIAVTSILCQMIAALPKEQGDTAIKTTIEEVKNGVEELRNDPSENRFATGRPRLNA